jgi:hypothetical protein
VNFDFHNSRLLSEKSIIYLSILLYSTLLEKKLFDTAIDSLDWDEDNKMRKELIIQREIERLTYTAIRFFSKNMYFVDAIRANVQRLYTYASQGTSFNDQLLRFMRQIRTGGEVKFINKWVKEFEIGDSIRLGRFSGIGNQIWITKCEREVSLADVGYGVTPFLALLINIISAINESTETTNTIIIQEPETNLHPKLQSKLADFIWDAQKTFNINFIIETHSEYLIRKFQFLTAKGDINPDNMVIHYLGADNEEQISTIHIKPNGQLSKPFESGFTDESLKWLKEMFFYSNQG